MAESGQDETRPGRPTLSQTRLNDQLGRTPEVPDKRPALVITPFAPELEVRRRVALLLEAATSNQCDGTQVCRLGVGFQAVQSKFAEGMTRNKESPRFM